MVVSSSKPGLQRIMDSTYITGLFLKLSHIVDYAILIPHTPSRLQIASRMPEVAGQCILRAISISSLITCLACHSAAAR